MSSLRELSEQASAMAVQVAREHHAGQTDGMARTSVEKAVQALLDAKRHLIKAHRQLNGDDPISGVA
jgi:hypothetical protein